jgi:hypothetical protein
MTDTPTQSEHRGARQSHLLNRSEVRKFILDTIGRYRPSLGISRVSGESLDKLEYWLREKIRLEVHSHPSIGKTFRLL